MAQANYQSEQRIATLIEITVEGRDPLRFQNYSVEDYFYQNRPYAYVPFKGGVGASRSIGLGSSGGEAKVGNVSSRQSSLRPIRDWLKRDDGWRKARVVVRHLWPEEPSAPPIVERRQILSSGVAGAEITLILKSATDATNARIPNLILTRQIAPELPSTAPTRG